MRKSLSILALAVFTITLFSCESDTNVSETENLFESISDQDATTGDSSSNNDRN